MSDEQAAIEEALVFDTRPVLKRYSNVGRSMNSVLESKTISGACIIVVAIGLFSIIAAVTGSGFAMSFEVYVVEWFRAHRTPGLTRVLLCISELHSTPVVLAITLVISLYFAWLRTWFSVLAVVLAIPGGMLINSFLKEAFHRARPALEDNVANVATYSFPSGHVVAATALYGILVMLVIPRIRARQWRVLAMLAAILMLLLVGLSRIYLGAHYPSDVLAGYAEAVAWLTLCVDRCVTRRQH